MKIREFLPKDYKAIVSIHASQNIVWPEYPPSPEAWANVDHARSSKTKFRRWVALEFEQVVGFASYSSSPWTYPPGGADINVEVLPPYQRRGIGSALYQQILEGIQAINPTALRADAFTNLPQGFTFLQKRGFYEAFRETPVS